MAKENNTWGYDRIQGALSNLGYIVAPNTVKNILLRHGIDPAPERQKRTSWSNFLKTHWDVMAATDFFTVEVWSRNGLVTYYILFVIQLSSRAVNITGITTKPNGKFMEQIARNLTEEEGGFLRGSSYLIMDRDTKFTKEFKAILVREGIKPIMCPVRAPNCNAFAERFVRSIKEECLNRLILFSEESLRRSINEFVLHYHTERNHQGVGNKLLRPLVGSSSANDPVYRRARIFAPYGLLH